MNDGLSQSSKLEPGGEVIPFSLSNFRDVHTHNLDAGPEAIINLPPGVYEPLRKDWHFSVGVHPWDSDGDYDLDAIAVAAEHPQIVAIGECGLDALRGADLATQEEIFRWHIALSERLGKPLIIHAVRTIQRIIEIHRELRPIQPWLIHGFRGKPQLAASLVREGIHISIGQKFNPAILEVVPPTLLHHESDDNY